MTTGSITDILAAALPIALAIILGILGAVRGFWREAIVSASIVLGALIVQQWASSWADDLYGMYTGVSREWQQVILSQTLLVLIVLVLGYGLGTLISREPLSGGSRVGGLLLGLMNGSAIGGWLLRYVYVSLDNASSSSNLYQNLITQYFMIWSGWFPVALAALGALVAIIAPFRRPRVVVTEPVRPPVPAPVPNWTPPPTGPTYTVPGPPPTIAYGAPPQSRIGGTVSASTPYDRTVANLTPYATDPRLQAPYDAPRTQAFGGMDPPPPPQSYQSYNPYPPGYTTRGLSPSTRDEGEAPPTELLPDRDQVDTSKAGPTYRSGLGGKVDTDSLLAPVPSGDSDEPQKSSASASESAQPTPDWLATPTAQYRTDTVTEPETADAEGPQKEEPELQEAAPVAEASDPNETKNEPENAAPATIYTPTEETCANCGAPVLNNAQFCTECGTRVVRA